MKIVYANSALFRFMNVLSSVVVVSTLAIAYLSKQSDVWYLLFLSLFFTLLSLIFLVNRIVYDDHIIRFMFLLKKRIVDYTEIKEVYYKYDLISGCKVVFNFERKTDIEYCCSVHDYVKTCKEQEITNAFLWGGIRKKDLYKLLDNYQGSIITNIKHKSKR